tara:strand:+ start:1763 stop:1939 length:177 start_codon:yes stop_codon:yes gene_type:complete
MSTSIDYSDSAIKVRAKYAKIRMLSKLKTKAKELCVGILILLLIGVDWVNPLLNNFGL